jgi:N-methylhydantoinase B/oxoprolinase/acetone carboxylase alpha subunit
MLCHSRLFQGGMFLSKQVPVKTVKIGMKEYDVIHLFQSDLGIETWVYPDTQINVYGNDTAIKTLADIYDGVRTYNVIAYLERHSSEGADLVIFHGQSTPLNFRSAHQIRKTLKKISTGKTITLNVRLETDNDKMKEDWKFTKTLSVRVEDHLVLINGSTLGLRLCALECLYLTQNDLGHQHYGR